MINPRYFEYALMIERFGSFKRAALEMHVSQPALSKGIAALESEFHVQIFERDSRPLAPTEAGKLILAEASRFMDGEKQLRERLLQLQRVVNHKVRIAWGPYTGMVYAPRFVTAFQKAFPLSELYLQTCRWDQPQQLLRNREIDLFVGDISAGYLIEEFLITPLKQEQLCLICHPSHPMAKSLKLEAPEIFHHPLLLCSPPPWAKAWLRKYMPHHDPRESPAHIRIDDYRLIRDILLKNDHLATLATRSCFPDELSEGSLCSFPFEGAPSMQAGIAVGKTGEPLSILPELIDMILSIST